MPVMAYYCSGTGGNCYSNSDCEAGQYCNLDDDCINSVNDEPKSPVELLVPPYDGTLETHEVTFAPVIYSDNGYYVSRSINNEPIIEGKYVPGDTLYRIPGYTMIWNIWIPRKTTIESTISYKPGICTNLSVYPQCDFNSYIQNPCDAYSGWLGDYNQIHVVRRQLSCNTGVATCNIIYDQFVNCVSVYGTGVYPRQMDTNDSSSWVCYKPCDGLIENNQFTVFNYTSQSSNPSDNNGFITNFSISDQGCSIVNNEILENQSQSVLNNLNGLKIKSNTGQILAVFTRISTTGNTKLYLKGLNFNKQIGTCPISMGGYNFSDPKCYYSLRAINLWNNSGLNLLGSNINLNNPQDVFIIKNGSGSIIGFIDQQGNFATIGKITVNNAG